MVHWPNSLTRSLTSSNGVNLALLLIITLGLDGSNAYDWMSGTGVTYALGCDFYGNDIGNQPSPGEDCGCICATNNNCDHFTWYNGVCYLKRAVNPPANDLSGGVCGWVTNRSACQGNKIKQIEYPAVNNSLHLAIFS